MPPGSYGPVGRRRRQRPRSGQAFRQDAVGAVAPVVEVACDDQRRAVRRDLFEIFRQRRHLADAGAPEQRKMDTDAVRDDAAGQADLAVQQAAPLELQMGYVLVVRIDDRVAGRIALPWCPWS